MRGRVSGAVLSAVVVVAALAGCAAEPEGAGAAAERPRSLLLLTLDTTRADHLEPYGAPVGASPALAGLARQGVTFERATAVSPLTLPTHATLLTGLYPPQHGLRNNGSHHLPPRVRTLAERLRERGLRTAAFVSAAVLDRRYGLDRGFETYDDELDGGERQERMVVERPAAPTVAAARAWLDGRRPGSPSSSGSTSSTRTRPTRRRTPVQRASRRGPTTARSPTWTPRSGDSLEASASWRRRRRRNPGRRSPRITARAWASTASRPTACSPTTSTLRVPLDPARSPAGRPAGASPGR